MKATNLIEGRHYYADKSKENILEFVKKDEDEIYFKRVSGSGYSENSDGLIDFIDIYGDWEEVTPIRPREATMIRKEFDSIDTSTVNGYDDAMLIIEIATTRGHDKLAEEMRKDLKL